MMAALPRNTGTYALFLSLTQRVFLQVGKLGNFSFPAGRYIYLGSACGPGGLRRRLQRHLRGNSPNPHWHIDYLRGIAKVEALCYSVDPQAKNWCIPLECQWTQVLAEFPQSAIPVPGFGASDCKSNCEAHLVHFTFYDWQVADDLSYTRLLEALRISCDCEPCVAVYG